MKEIELEELKNIQLEILIKVHEFCITHNINYSISSGTLLGAVRHKGYIPWDDDIDIWMLRPDFEKFEHEFVDEYLRIMSPDVNEKCIYPYGKVYDSRTILIESVNNSIDYLGVNIDVFVIDSVPDNMKERKRLFKINRILDDIIMFKTIKNRKGRSFIKTASLFVGKLLCFYIPLKWVIQKKYNLCVPYNGKSNDICNVMAGNGIKSCVSKTIMDSFIDIEYEGRKFKCMIGYDTYLRINYGDYMILPPEEKQVSHHDFEAYWK